MPFSLTPSGGYHICVFNCAGVVIYSCKFHFINLISKYVQGKNHKEIELQIFINKLLELLYLQNHLPKLINCAIIIASVERKYKVQSKETLI